MCGIVGYTGFRQAQPLILQGLAHLEYRGYDSAGIGVGGPEGIAVCKAAGKLQRLKERLAARPLWGQWGLGHTRWATHGEPGDLNAHPHAAGGIALVHNGVIENHADLRRELETQGAVFITRTDTEVILQLLLRLYEGDMLRALARAAERLRGSYALGVLAADRPGELFGIRCRSPLVIGLGRGENFIASDVPALLPHTRRLVVMQEGQIARLTPERAELYDRQLAPLPLEETRAQWEVADAEKGGHPHFMLKEILEQPEALERTLAAHQQEAFPLNKEEARKLSSLTIAACGTAYHAGLLGRSWLEELARLPVRVELASEYRYSPPLTPEGEGFLAISQSGETADTLAALEEAGRRGMGGLALCNVPGSSLARAAGEGRVMYTQAGPEIAVASTKAYLTQAQTLFLWALDLGEKRGVLSPARKAFFLEEMARLPDKARQVLARRERMRSFIRRVGKGPLFFMGRGRDHALALEAALKVKEVACLHCEAFAAGEMKHGPLALVAPRVPVAAIATQPHLADKLLANVEEVRARGGFGVILCPESMQARCAAEGDACWPLPDAPAELLPMLAILPLQLLAYDLALARGCDVDRPRNLAKSVTVE